MYHFQYVAKKELKPAKKQLMELIHKVQDEVRDNFTFQYEFVGSVKRNMVTWDVKSNVGFDFDVNIRVNDDDEEFEAKDIKKILVRAFNNHAWKYGYDSCEDSTRVFTIKVKDRKKSRIRHSCDFAVVNDYGNNRQKYIRFNKQRKNYTWEEQTKGFYYLPEKIKFVKIINYGRKLERYIWIRRIIIRTVTRNLGRYLRKQFMKSAIEMDFTISTIKERLTIKSQDLK